MKIASMPQRPRIQERGKTMNEICVRICGGGGCLASGSQIIAQEFERLVAQNKEALGGKVQVHLKHTGCQGPCSRGPVVTIDPDGTVYGPLKPEDVQSIVDQHLLHGQPVENLIFNAKPFFQGQTKLVLRNCGNIDPTKIFEYEQAGGYRALVKARKELRPEQVIDMVKQSGLRGRGGAGFPTWRKWDLARRKTLDNLEKEKEGLPHKESYILCNADEGDPGAFMDRSLLEGDPHSIIEGMALAGYAVGAHKGYVYVRAEYPLAVLRLNEAIEQATQKGYLGKDEFQLEIRKGSGAFVCGEETALIASLEGKRGEPRPRPPFPADEGLWGCPTVLNNVETYANVAPIIDLGPEFLTNVGTGSSPGTKVFALAGSVLNTGLVEVPIGTPLGELIYDIGGGIPGGRQFKAAQIGGPSGGCIPKDHLNVPLDYDSLKELGAIMGSGGLIVMDDESCMVDVARFFLDFVQDESCGTCLPCRVGTKRMLETIDRIVNGLGSLEDLDQLEALGTTIGETALCGLGQTAPNPVLSTLRWFRQEYEQHIQEGHCAAGVCPSLVRAPCQSACPAGVDIPGFVALTGERRYQEALVLHRNRNPFAAVCARVCFHTCEDHCRRSSLDSPVSIRGIKRFLTDQEVVIQRPEIRINPENADFKVAIIGAGPAGLSCAYFLARLGYRPEIFEAEHRPGGMLVQTIPEYRLPREVLAREIRMIEHMGVTIKTGMRFGTDITLDSLKEQGYQAVFFGIGASGSSSLGIPGEEADGVLQALPFLKEYNIRGSVPVGKNVIVVGGGNAAIDAARTALRLGAETVEVVYRRSQDQMPAYAEEVQEAIREGIGLRCLTQPVEILVEDGKVQGMLCSPMELGSFDSSGRRRAMQQKGSMIRLKADQIILAVGQTMDPAARDAITLPMNDSGFIHCDPVTGATELDWVFAGGDCATGPDSVVGAIGAGEKAAVSMDVFLTGASHAFWRTESPVDVSFDPDADPVPWGREALPALDVNRRVHSFEEVERSWSEGSAIRQCLRCLRCDYGKPVKTLDPALKTFNSTDSKEKEVAHASN